MKIEENEVYTTKEVAEMLRVSMPTIKRMLKDGRLPSTRIGRQHRFLGKDLLDILTNREDLSKKAHEADTTPAPAPVARYSRPTVSPAPQQTAAPVQTQPKIVPEKVSTPHIPAVVAPAPVQKPVQRFSPPLIQLNAIEERQRTYMLGRTVQRDVLDDDGNILFRAGIEVTDPIIIEAKKTRKMMDLFSSLRAAEE